MGLQESFANETVSRLALRPPVVCAPADSIAEAVGRMRRQKLGCVIVVDDARRPVGMFTESMLTQILASDPDGLSAPIESKMSTDCHTVTLDEPVARVLAAMERANTRFLVVVDGEGAVSGLTGQKGLMEFIADHFPQQIMVQRVGKRAPQEREGA